MRLIRICLSVLVFLSIFGISPRTTGEPGSGPPRPIIMQEIHTVLADEQSDLRALQADLAKAQDETEALVILRQIAQRKQETEIAVLRIQERRARELGDEKSALRIDQAIRRILNPEPVAPGPGAEREIEARRAAAASRE